MLFSLQTPIWQLFFNIFFNNWNTYYSWISIVYVFRYPLNVISGQYVFFCRAVKIADFANYVQKLHADSNLLFSSEYKVIFYINQRHTFFSNNCFITLRFLMVMQHMDVKKVIRKLHPWFRSSFWRKPAQPTPPRLLRFRWTG